MHYALKVWGDITPLNFHEVAGSAADIQIDFSTADHNDRYPFDGPGGTVAHAFFPGDHHTAGDTHFDDDEAWTFRSSGACVGLSPGDPTSPGGPPWTTEVAGSHTDPVKRPNPGTPVRSQEQLGSSSSGRLTPITGRDPTGQRAGLGVRAWGSVSSGRAACPRLVSSPRRCGCGWGGEAPWGSSTHRPYEGPGPWGAGVLRRSLHPGPRSASIERVNPQHLARGHAPPHPCDHVRVSPSPVAHRPCGSPSPIACCPVNRCPWLTSPPFLTIPRGSLSPKAHSSLCPQMPTAWTCSRWLCTSLATPLG